MIPYYLRRVIDAVIGDHHKRCRVYNSLDISTTDAVSKILTFDTERFDTDSMHSISTNTSRLTCNTAGAYHITASIDWDINGTGLRNIYIRLNGSTSLAHSTTGGNASYAVAQTIDTIYELAIGDYVEISVSQTSGGNLSVLSSGNTSPEFSMFRISRIAA